MTAGSYEGYFDIRHPDLGCVEVFNQCRTMAYVAGLPFSHDLNVAESCTDCCCFAFDEGYGTTPAEDPNPAPWYDASDPASLEFLGLRGDITVGLVDDPTGIGGRKRRLTYTGLLLSSCDAGRTYGLAWLTKLLEGACIRCSDVTGTVFAFCGGDNDDNPTLVFDNPRPDPLIGRSCCDPIVNEPPTLDIPDIAPVVPDTGIRTLNGLSYVAGSLQPLAAGVDNWPKCYGCRITFSFDIDSSNSFGPVTEVCTGGVEVGDPATAMWAGIDPDCDCRAITFAADEDDDCERCGRGCICQPDDGIETNNECSTPISYSGDNLAACIHSQPLCWSRRTCITPTTPYAESALIIELFAGATAADVTLNIWDALPGLPDPGTCVGADIYCNRAPTTSPWGVHLPAGATVTIDGRTGKVTSDCPVDGSTSGGHLVDVCERTSLVVPTVCCGDRVWISVDADCYNLPADDFRIRVSLAAQYPA